jgi:glycosyltransferase involved in cell wall biosynthesis
MKLIFITREGYRLPGARIRCYNFAKEINKYGIDTEVLSFSDTLGAKDGEKESQLRLTDKIRFNLCAFKKLAKQKNAVLYLQRFNYHSFAPYLAYVFNKNKIILDLDDWEMRENPRQYFGFYPSSKAHFFTSWIAKRSVFCIAASHFLKDFLLEFNKNVFYIPSGVDTELFRPSVKNLGDDKIIFSWVGTLHRKEYIDNISLALKCFAALRKEYNHIYFDIVGDGIYKKYLIDILKIFDDAHIRLRGWLNPCDIPAYLDNIHIGLMPIVSKTKFNLAKSPTKLFEYMAMAKPTISSSIGESSHIIKDGYDGFLVHTKDEFIEKMNELIHNIKLRQYLGYNARKTIEGKYSLKVMGSRLYGALARLEN